MVSSIKAFYSILLGHQITVYTDNKNLIYKNPTLTFLITERVKSWRLILEQIGPELKYIKGENIVVAKALSCLDMSDNQDILNISEIYVYNDDDLPDSAYPNLYFSIAKAQKTDARLQQKLV